MKLRPLQHICAPIYRHAMTGPWQNLRPIQAVRCLHRSTLTNPTPRRSKRLKVAQHDKTKLFTDEELELLRKEYTKEQMETVVAAESAVDVTDLDRARDRRDPYALPYFTDLNTIDPFLDFPSSKVMPGHYPQQPVPKMSEIPFNDGDEDAVRQGILSQMTGFKPSYLRQLQIKHLVVHRVVNQTRLGKVQKMYVLSVAGDGNGMLGIGEGKATEGDAAIRLANYQAVKNMRPIPRYEGRTIHGDIDIKIGAVELQLMARPPGFGVRCSQYIFEICRCCGITDLAARVTRSRNPMNVIKATQQALLSQKLPDTIARGRGKKIVDVRKVYYGQSTF